MKTITQYKEEIKALRKSAGDLNAKATQENRDLLPEELSLKNEILDKVEELENIVSTLEREERITARLEKPPAPETKPKPQKTDGVVVGIDNRTQDRFQSFGQQLMAVISASRPGGHVDPRLFKGAATGLSEGIPSDGGFLVQEDYLTELLQDVYATGVLAQRCRRIQISGNANSMKINGVDETSRASTRYGGVVGYWKDEAAAKTASKPKFRKIELSLNKLIGLCYATDELLQDASALESFIRMAFAGEFGFLTDDAIINGSGVGQPLGVMNSGSLVTVTAETGQAAATLLSENISKMYARRFASQTQNYVWLYNQTIEPQLDQLNISVGTGGVPVYMPPGGLSAAPYGRIKGLPAIAIEQCAALGTTGDIILANFPNGYILAEKGGLQTAMSIHVQFVYDESVFRFVMRLDGQPVRSSALTPYKGGSGATQSHFIVLATRS